MNEGGKREGGRPVRWVGVEARGCIKSTKNTTSLRPPRQPRDLPHPQQPRSAVSRRRHEDRITFPRSPLNAAILLPFPIRIYNRRCSAFVTGNENRSPPFSRRRVKRLSRRMRSAFLVPHSVLKSWRRGGRGGGGGLEEEAPRREPRSNGFECVALPFHNGGQIMDEFSIVRKSGGKRVVKRNLQNEKVFISLSWLTRVDIACNPAD